MARKGGRGGNKAARSAAAKKGWETRRRGGAKSKPAATKRTAATKAKGNEYGTGVVAQRKKAMSARLVAAGKGIGTRNPQQAAYIRAQNINIIGQRLASEGKGNKAARRAAQLATKAKAAKTTARRGMPKTTSARGRALTNQRRAADLVRASRGGKGPSAKAVRSVLTAQRARAFYAATGGGKKRSAVKAKSAAKIGKSIRAESRAKATAARAKVAGRPRSRVVASPAQQRAAGLRARADQLRQQGNALMGGGGRRDGAIVNAPLSSRARSGSINAGLRGLEMTRRADRLESRARGVEVRAQQSAAKAAREAAKPKPQRKPAAQRTSRAREIVQRRERKGSGTQRQWENAVRAERRALAFLGAKPKQLTSQQQFWRDMVR